MSLYVFGDSHANFNLQGHNVINKYNIINLYQNSLTMHRIGRDNMLPGFNTQLNNKNNIFLFFYGEVDCRCHVYKQKQLERNVDEIISELAINYINTIKNNVKEYRRIIIGSITPPVDLIVHENLYGVMSDDFPYPILGSNEERVTWTKLLNDILKEECIKNNFIFMDTYSKYADDKGTLLFDLSYSVHITNNAFIIEELSRVLESIDNS
jgi:hypothetical protein